jgi:polyisoprenoid-binding protein YceI
MLAVSLLGCSTRPRLPPPGPGSALPAQPTVPVTGRAYAIIPSESLLTILVFRGGLLASAGHNHVIASHALSGTIHVPAQVLQTTFDVHLPLTTLTIDEPELRQALHRDDFPPEVPEAARAGTRQNMLGEALLNAAQWPEIVLRSAGFVPASSSGGDVIASVVATVRGQDSLLKVPVHYQVEGDNLTVTGELSLKQSQLGLTPFSAFMGALTVQDEMHVRIELRARAVAPAG